MKSWAMKCRWCFGHTEHRAVLTCPDACRTPPCLQGSHTPNLVQRWQQRSCASEWPPRPWRKTCTACHTHDEMPHSHADMFITPLITYLVRLQHSSHHFAAGEHIHAHVDVGVATPGAAESLHGLQALLGPVVVGEETVAGVEKHTVMNQRVKTTQHLIEHFLLIEPNSIFFNHGTFT